MPENVLTGGQEPRGCSVVMQGERGLPVVAPPPPERVEIVMYQSRIELGGAVSAAIDYLLRLIDFLLRLITRPFARGTKVAKTFTRVTARDVVGGTATVDEFVAGAGRASFAVLVAMLDDARREFPKLRHGSSGPELHAVQIAVVRALLQFAAAMSPANLKSGGSALAVLESMEGYAVHVLESQLNDEDVYAIYDNGRADELRAAIREYRLAQE